MPLPLILCVHSKSLSALLVHHSSSLVDSLSLCSTLPTELALSACSLTGHKLPLDHCMPSSTMPTLLWKKGINILDGNGLKKFLEKWGLGHHHTGDLGPICGYQWRHVGAKYVDTDTDHSGQGINQLRKVIHKIEKNPTDRRIVMSAWNPAGLSLAFHCTQLTDIPLMVLLPCHMIYQFYVHLLGQDNPSAPWWLSCLIYQRTADLGLGAWSPIWYRIPRTTDAHDCVYD